MGNSSVSIDYLSFSVDTKDVVSIAPLALKETSGALQSLLGTSIFKEVFLEPDGWQVASGQRPYQYGQANHNIGVFVWFGGQSTALVQFSGQGCKFLERNDIMGQVLERVHDRMTRLDIAIDIETDVRPIDFVREGYNNRIKSYGEQRSASGETCYIGSRKSEKFCRVYRYSSPHPRSHLLRVEYETKKEQSKITAASILKDGLLYTAQSITKYYEWRSKVMPKPNDMVEKIQSMVSNRNDAKTVHWMLTQVAPAFKRLVENGTIENPEQFFVENFMPKDTKNK